MSSTTLVETNRSPWIFKRFVKEKLDVRERYWQIFHPDHHVLLPTGKERLVVPDGFLWRKFLKLWMFLAERCSSLLQLVLLESAVEYMDWRNASLLLDTQNGERRHEATAFQEKSRLRKLVESYRVTPFCDLSVREVECDEFDILDYPAMTVEGRSRAALIRAGRLLAAGGIARQVIVLDSADPRIEERFLCDEVKVETVDDFLSHLRNEELVSTDVAREMFTVKVRCEEEYQRRNFASSTESCRSSGYLSEGDIQKGLMDGTLARGRLEVTQENAKEGYVTTSNGRFFINQNEGHFNRALHHDIIVIRPLPENQWGRPIGRRRLIRNADSEDTEFSDDAGLAVPSAVVVAVAESSRRIYVATLVDTPGIEERTIICVPMDTRIPKIRLQTRDWQKFQNQRLLVEIDEWEMDSNYPIGHCIECLGRIGNLETEILCLLLEHEIKFTPFSASAISLLPPEGHNWSIADQEISSRRDLRKTHRIFSVDPVGCQDIDDAMHVKVLANGDVEVGVHIADVNYFLPQNSDLDKQAQLRATTFYLVDRRFDMLPALLSSDLCSLHGNKDRLAVSVIWIMSSDFDKIKSTWLGRTVIHNCQAMTYEQAHNILHDQPPDDPSQPQPPPLTAGYKVEQNSVPMLKNDLTVLTHVARKLRTKREDTGGAVDLSNGELGNELKFSLDAEGNPMKINVKKELEIHHTIAELMILANQTVAEKIYQAFPNSALLRVHRKVEESRFDDLENAFKAWGIAFDGSSNASLAESLRNAKLRSKDKPIVYSLWQSLATRAMSEALYVSSGQTVSGLSLSHYGLGIEKYTHFTSPIRRYADVVVHRQLLVALKNDERRSSIGPPPGFVERKALESLPDSSAISIMRGDGLKDVFDKWNYSSIHSESLTESHSKVTVDASQATPPSKVIIEKSRRILDPPYTEIDIARICDNLNVQNRRAKMSSMDCQKLFLSLYFRDHVEDAMAVVTNLKTNGLIAFVPKFDISGPVYLCDAVGAVQVDPTLIGLPVDSGVDATQGFLAGRKIRRFPTGQLILTEDPNDESKSRLKVVVPGAKTHLLFRTLDAITVQISCDFSDVRARIPRPRFHLVSGEGSSPASQKSGSHYSTHGTKSKKVSSEALISSQHYRSMYQDVQTHTIGSVSSSGVSTRRQRNSFPFHSAISGRKTFSNFVNPDTRAAQQEAAVIAASDAAAQRRMVSQSSNERRNEYDTNRSIERAITARTQRLAAVKRNARKSGSK
jgi:VacB/RNase II family 3'-5' exoribonuclease